MKNYTTYTYNNITDTVAGWSNRTGIQKNTIRNRLKAGWTIEKTLTYSTKPAHITGYKICCKCGQNKTISEFHRLKRRNGNEFNSFCKICDRNRTRDERQDRREKIIAKYSDNQNKCALCSESRLEVLDIDHIDGNGKLDRERFDTNDQYYRYLLSKKKDKNLRVLCRNCNWIEHLRLRNWGVMAQKNS